MRSEIRKNQPGKSAALLETSMNMTAADYAALNILKGPYTGGGVVDHDGPCPFMESTGTKDMMCVDGTLCDPETHAWGWGCCMHHNGKKKCTGDYPLMCNFKTCHLDYCCDQAGCHSYGGLRHCTECVESLRGFRDDAYRGCQTQTRSGKTCQAWDTQWPHAHAMHPTDFPLADLRENYCRNP